MFYYYPIGTDYFSIYNANTSKIGKITNDNLRKTIINLYALAKFFIDSLESNNSCLDYYDKIYHKYNNITEEQRESIQEYQTALYRLELSKKENLLPTYNKLVKLFEHLENIENLN